MKTLTSSRHCKTITESTKCQQVHKFSSTSLPRSWGDPESPEALGMHWADQKTSVKTYFICGHHFSSVHSDFHSWPKKKKKVPKIKRKKMKSKVFIPKLYWFFFIYKQKTKNKNQPGLSIKNKMSKVLNLRCTKNPNLLLASRRASHLEQKQKRAQPDPGL